MGKKCEVSGKKTSFGNHITTRGKAKYLGGVGIKTTGISRRTAASRGRVTGSVSWDRGTASATSNPPTRVRRNAVRWPPTPSAAPRSRASALT